MKEYEQICAYAIIEFQHPRKSNLHGSRNNPASHIADKEKFCMLCYDATQEILRDRVVVPPTV